MSLQGRREAQTALERFGEQVQRTALTALEAGALIIKAAAQDKCPHITGTLRRSIHVQPVERSEERVVVAVGPTEPYGRRIEFGFSDKDKLGRTYNQRPQPYMRPAFDENKDRVTKEVADVFAMLRGEGGRS